jgi:hypothetical protein
VRPRLARAAAMAAAVLWLLFCLRWFDPGAPWRPRWLSAVPAVVLAVGCAGALALAVWARRGRAWNRETASVARAAGLTAVLAVLVRVPLAWWGGAGYVTPDGALSGIVSLHAGNGTEHLVFVPHVPYSGSLKSHLAALLSLAVDPARAFALVSVFFYGVFVAVVARLAGRVVGGGGATALWAGLSLALAPAFVTRYSLSNDGNYVEVLALGTLALLLADRWIREVPERPALAWLIGLALGLAFWCHILAVLHAATAVIALAMEGRREGLRDLVRVAAGAVVGYLPGLLWNAGAGWASFLYLLPGHPVGAIEEGPGLFGRMLGIARDQLPVLVGYDPGYGRAVDRVLLVFAAFALVAVAVSAAVALRCAREEGQTALRILGLLAAVNVLVAVVALPYIPGNPRYLLFLAAPIAVGLALTLSGRLRWLLAVLIAGGAATSVAQVPAALRSDAQWRGFVADLQAAGVRWCHTDFYLATKVVFLSKEAVVCSAKLGPTTTEYFFAYRTAVEQAPEAALVAVNGTAADKLERRLQRLGVSYERRDLMKPVLLRLSRKVDPSELFPDRELPLR